ncbi:hypothetical protein L484_015162 [Morus notabilis]|uniref:Uncharacterized protein n=1 Tax=Morus notabilis TaxID=981085 RepID=W9SB28_9ROSA|nr:glycine-rich protein 5 [Morus notabilis]EXC24147.1 hypothetical protein L484_015162 [Morus notabilis]
MATKWCIALVLALAVVHATARNVPAATPAKKDAGLNDQKNFLTYGGVGGYSGLGANGLPFGGFGAGVGGGGGLGGGLGGGGGIGGFGGLGGAGGLGGGGGGGVGGAGAGTGIGPGGVVPFP